METKICNRCFIEKPINKFNKHHKTKDGYQKLCRVCKTGTPEGFKKCTVGKIHCNKIKPLSEFNRQKGMADGRTNQCKGCCNDGRKKPKEILQEGLRRCTKCKEVKTFDMFYKSKDCSFGIRSICKKCLTKPKEDLPEGYKRCTGQCNKIKPLSDFGKNSKNGKFGLRSDCKMCRRYKRNKQQKEKYDNDILYRLYCSMQKMCRKTLKLIGTPKEKRTVKELGYVPLQLMKRLEVNFTDGMSHDNYGKLNDGTWGWEIDHTISRDHFI